jgi:hypothetical protein
MPATIRAGIAELTAPVAARTSASKSRQRIPGGGRKSLEDKDPQLAITLEKRKRSPKRHLKILAGA